MKKVILFMLIMFFISMSMFSNTIKNNAESAYNESSENSEHTNSQIKTLIVLANGHFLEANAGFQSFLSNVQLAEINGMDYGHLRLKLSNIIAANDSAESTYRELVNLAEVTPYNNKVIQKLKQFDYNGFAKDNDLNKSVFLQVESSLSKGRVTEIFGDLAAKTSSISSLMQRVKKRLDKNLSPDMNTLCKINQLYAEGGLTGQYAAMVFRVIEK